MVLNLGAEPQTAENPQFAGLTVEVSTCPDREGQTVGPIVTLRPDEGLILSRTGTP
jgi:hypothetical protein